MRIRPNKSASDQATGCRRSVAASDSLNIPVNSHSLASRMQQSHIKDEIEYKYDPKKGSFNETKHKASVLAAAADSPMSLSHHAVTSVRANREASGNSGIAPMGYGSRRRSRASDDE